MASLWGLLKPGLEIKITREQKAIKNVPNSTDGIKLR